MNRLIHFCFLTSILISFHSTKVLSQVNGQNELSFAEYLINAKQYEDAITVLKDISSNKIQLQDSVNYMIGWAFYNWQKMDSSSIYLLQISDSSPFYSKAMFYLAFEYVDLGLLDEAANILETVEVQDELKPLLYLELGGIYLLMRKYGQFDSLASMFDSSFYTVIVEQQNLIEQGELLKRVKKKSAFLGGTFSAIIPGAGKLYAGYFGKAAAAFFSNAVFGAIAIENYIKAGASSAQFIVATSVFALFYIGNVWGSALSVPIRRNEKYRNIDNQVRYNLHLALRKTFY